MLIGAYGWSNSHLTWPSHTSRGTLRTINSINGIATAIETGRNSDEESEELTRDDRLGIVGTSLFLHQPRFNMINCIPAKYMHSVCPVSYTHLRAHETGRNLVCRLLLEKKK